jgi:ABC-type transport system involved in multi-copper enzyme maturation permease subunit
MFREIFRFEVGYHLRRPSTYLFFGILFVLAFLTIASDALSGGAGTRVLRNSPYEISRSMLILTMIGQVITAALAGTAILRDHDHKTHELIFTTPITKLGYFGGRFAGALVAMLLVYAAVPLGIAAGTLAPWVDAEKLGPFVAAHYASPFLVLLLPDVVFISALFFAAGVLLRSHFAVYTLGILLLVGDTIADELRKSLDNDRITAITDAFGWSTFDLTTRYWTPAEKNLLTVPMSGLMLMNRAFFLGVGVLFIVTAFYLFRFEVAPRTLRRARAAAEAREERAGTRAMPAVRTRFDSGALWQQLTSLARFHFTAIVRSPGFLAIAAIGIVNVFMSAWYQGQWYDTKLYPTTYYMAEMVVGAGKLFLVVLLTLFAGELVWRERALRADQMADALPVESMRFITGKLIGLALALAVMLVAGMLGTIAVQLARGYTQLELGLYLRWIFLAEYPSLLALTLLAFFVHTVLNQKYVGHFVMLVIFVGLEVVSNLGFEHRLYLFGHTAPFTYSDMNGFGHFVPRLAWFYAYYLALGLVLLAVAALFWVRGTESTRRARLLLARSRFTRRMAAFTASAALVTLFCGASIYRSTTVLNRYETKKEREARQAEYERTYRGYIDLAQPKIVGVQIAADLVPEERRFRFGGTYHLVNPHDRPVDTLYVGVSALAGEPNLVLDSLVLSRSAEEIRKDLRHGVLLYRLTEPLAPGDSIRLTFALRYDARGFPNATTNTAIVANGSFISDDYVPYLGYEPLLELTDTDARKKQKLPPRERMPKITDPRGLAHSQFSRDADWVSFEATISTAPDQIAVAPGYLQREWTEGGRRYFHYLSDTPIAKFFSVLSARYAVHRDRWVGAGGEPVAIEIFHHPGHEYNLDRMTASVKKSLDYFTRTFTPYQFRQVRILEFPRYRDFAQSFPNTIPYSEGIGFVTRVGSEDDDIDMPFFVTAHEVAHQWWGHQVVGASVQGADIMVESLAEYSALKVMEHEYGRDATHKFLRYELDRYLRGRANERIREQPLVLTEQQPYIHYNKGSLAFYALQDQIGEERLNGALRKFLLGHHYPSAAPYPTSQELIAELRAATPDSLQHVVTDLFETITLWDHKAEEATAVKRADGKYAVTLTVNARKLRADSLGNETEIALGDWVDVGVFGPREPGNKLGRPLYLEKHRITEPVMRIEVMVDQLPVKAGIDPYNKLIDREPKDNVREVALRR